MAYPDYESRAEAEVSKALRHHALKAQMHRRRRVKVMVATMVPVSLLPIWLDLPPFYASLVSGLLASAIFLLIERLIVRKP